MTSKYKGVKRQKKESSGSKGWVCTYNRKQSYFHTEEAAAKNYDLCCIRDQKEPVNGFFTRVENPDKQ